LLWPKIYYIDVQPDLAKTLNRIFLLKKCALLFASFLMLQCAQKSPGTLQVAFQFNKAEGDVEPSYQLAVWLEDVNENYVTTLFLSEYLSYGGYNDTTICPNWNAKADWDNAPMEAYDAVTRATPPVGENVLEFALDTVNVELGEYLCCVQAHLIENYNITFKTKINLKAEGQATTDAIYEPKVYAGAEHFLANVTARVVKEN
jgi:hypothetical protein